MVGEDFRDLVQDQLTKDWASVTQRRGSRLVVLSAPHGWGRTSTFRRFGRSIQANRSGTVIQFDGHSAPNEPGLLCTQLGALIRRPNGFNQTIDLFGLQSPEGVLSLASGISGLTFEPILSGPIGLALSLLLTAEGNLRDRLFPDLAHKARALGSRLARASRGTPIAVLIDNGDLFKKSTFNTLEHFLFALVSNPSGSVLVVLVTAPRSELGNDIAENSRYSTPGGTFRRITAPASDMTPADRRAVARFELPNWSGPALDRLAWKTKTLSEVRQVCAAPGAADVAQIPPEEVVEAVDLLTDAVLPGEPTPSEAAMLLLFAGGLMHSSQLNSMLTVRQGNSTAADVLHDEDIFRLPPSADRPSLYSAMRRELSGSVRDELAGLLAKQASEITGQSQLPLIERVAALRPVAHLLLAGRYSSNPTDFEKSLGLCADLIDCLAQAGDNDAAKDLAQAIADKFLGGPSGSTELELPNPAPSMGRVVAFLLRESVLTGVDNHHLRLAGSIANVGNRAVMGFEAQVWAAILRVQSTETRSEGLSFARDLLPFLTAPQLGEHALDWRLQLGAALASAGAVTLAVQALEPIFELSEDDELRRAATIISDAAGNHAKAVAAAAVLVRSELAGTPEEDVERIMGLHSALAGLFARAGSWSDARDEAEAELQCKLTLWRADDWSVLQAREEVAQWTFNAGNWERSLQLYEWLQLDFDRIYGRDSFESFNNRVNIINGVGSLRGAEQALTLSYELVPELERKRGRNNRVWVRAMAERAYWCGEAGDQRRALTILQGIQLDTERLFGPESSNALNNRGNIALNTADVEGPARALQLYESVLEDKERILGPLHSDTLRTRSNIARCIGDSGDAKGAADRLVGLIGDYEQVLGPNHPDSVRTRLKAAAWMDRAGVGQKTLEIREEAQSKLDSDSAEALSNRREIALLTAKLKGPAVALPLFRDVLADDLRVFGPDQIHTLVTRSDMAWRIGEVKGPLVALDLFREVLDDWFRIAGADHRETIRNRLFLAEWTSRAGNFGTAIELREEIQPDLDRVFGPDSDDALTNRREIAVLTAKLNGPTVALPLFREVLADDLRVFGPDHYHTLSTRSNLSWWNGEADGPQTAIGLLRELQLDWDRVFGPDHRETVMNRTYIADWLGRAGENQAALDLREEIQPDLDRVVGPESEQALPNRREIALLTAKLKGAKTALPLFREVLADDLRVFGPENLQTLVTRCNTAWRVGEVEGPQTAIGLLRELQLDWDRVFGPDHRETVMNRTYIADWLGRAGENQAALDLREEIQPDLDRVVGPESEQALSNRGEVALLTAKLKGPAVALPLFREVLADDLRVFGPENLQTLTYRTLVAYWSGQAGLEREALDLFRQIQPDLDRVVGPDSERALTNRANIAFYTGAVEGAEAAIPLFEENLAAKLRVFPSEHPEVAATRSNIEYWRARSQQPER